MKIQHKLGVAVATFALGFAPALAIAAHPNNGKHGSQSNSQANAQAFGKLCSKESKKHVAGGTATPFSQCIVAMKKAASGKANSPGQACKGLSKKHVAGMKGTPFSQCVVAAAHLLGNKGGTTTSTPAPTTTG
ncbi:MAG: hypothetical protein ACXVUL_18125 [Solirubrobacteraceae bacterium]